MQAVFFLTYDLNHNQLSCFTYFCFVKKVIAAFLLSVFFLQIFYVAGITVWFYANRAYISQKLCINKNRPELDCKGSCFLKKKLKEVEQKQEQQLPLQEKQLKESAPCVISTISYTVQAPSNTRVYNPTDAGIYSFTFYRDIFHPPSFIFS